MRVPKERRGTNGTTSNRSILRDCKNAAKNGQSRIEGDKRTKRAVLSTPLSSSSSLISESSLSNTDQVAERSSGNSTSRRSLSLDHNQLKRHHKNQQLQRQQRQQLQLQVQGQEECPHASMVLQKWYFSVNQLCTSEEVVFADHLLPLADQFGPDPDSESDSESDSASDDCSTRSSTSSTDSNSYSSGSDDYTLNRKDSPTYQHSNYGGDGHSRRDERLKQEKNPSEKEKANEDWSIQNPVFPAGQCSSTQESSKRTKTSSNAGRNGKTGMLCDTNNRKSGRTDLTQTSILDISEISSVDFDPPSSHGATASCFPSTSCGGRMDADPVPALSVRFHEWDGHEQFEINPAKGAMSPPAEIVFDSRHGHPRHHFRKGRSISSSVGIKQCDVPGGIDKKKTTTRIATKHNDSNGLPRKYKTRTSKNFDADASSSLVPSGCNPPKKVTQQKLLKMTTTTKTTIKTDNKIETGIKKMQEKQLKNGNSSSIVQGKRARDRRATGLWKTRLRSLFNPSFRTISKELKQKSTISNNN